MTDTPTDLLQAHFGFDRFMPGQREVIEHLLAGRSAAAVFPTGGGKSLCYQLPALAMPGLTLVISPLIALMKDQIDALTRRGIAAQRLDSTLDAAAYRETVDRARRGELRLLYISPERFNNERFRQLLGQLRISLFAVDEAHCISEWGHNFRPDYLKLPEFAKRAQAERVLALTATATPQVLKDICAAFEIDPTYAVRTGVYRPNLTLRFTPSHDQERDALLQERLRERPPGPTIVYVTLQRTAECVAEMLARQGHSARAYHAGMDAELRTEVQEWFLQSSDGIVVATIAFGMGIDKPDIRYVYHYNLPKSLENYAQEIGRAGRDGEPSTCETIACADDLPTLENFIYGDTPSMQAVDGLIRKIFSHGEAFGLSIYELSRGHDLRPLVTRTLLTYLELFRHIEVGTAFYASYRFQPLMPSRQILEQFDEHRRQFLATIFRQARKAKSWFDLDVDAAASQLDVPRERIIAALDFLAEKQMLELKAAGVRQRYRMIKRPDDLDALARRLHERTTQREANELHRLQQVVGLVEASGCQVAMLCEHFGEEHKSCGHCSWCLGDGSPASLPPRERPEVSEAIWQQAAAVRREHSAVLGCPRAMARFLCGLSSPGLSRSKLTRDPLFGRLERLPFAEVLKRFEGEG